MASSMIHIAVASKVNKKIKKDETKLFIGSIAPDIAKIVGDKKEKSHFIIKQFSNIPDISLFLNKYKKYLNDDFVLGYYIHLYTDYLWYKYFIPEIYSYNLVRKLDGTVVRCNQSEMMKYIYNDYTNINNDLVDEYNLNLKTFYNELPKFKKIIEEVPMERLNVLIDKTGIIIENTKHKKEYVFDMSNIKQFIETSSKLIIAKIEELGVK